jgi:hypothetical protein
LTASDRPANCQVLTPFFFADGAGVVGPAVVGPAVVGRALVGVAATPQRWLAPPVQAQSCRRVGGAVAAGVQALAGLRVHELPGGGGPLLGAGAVAVPQLDLRPVGAGAAGDVQALAQGLVGGPVGGPLLGAGAVAGPQLYRGPVGRVRPGHVDAFAADPGDGRRGRREGVAEPDGADDGDRGGGQEHGQRASALSCHAANVSHARGAVNALKPLLKRT